MNKSRVLSVLVSVYTTLWFALDGAWFFRWKSATAVLSVLVVALSFSAVFFMKRTRHGILISAAEFSWILFNVFWILFDLRDLPWCQPIAIFFLFSGMLCLAVALCFRTIFKVQQPFDSVIFRRLKI